MNHTDLDKAPAPPPRYLALGEGRAAIDLARMWLPLAASTLRRREIRDDRLVVVLPGFGTDDRSTLPLRRFLINKGYRTVGWSLGRNLAGLDLPHTLDDLSERWDVESREPYNGEAGVPFLSDRVSEKIAALYDEYQTPITLIGWSLGGYLARETARDLPTIVDQVITMGAPVIGGPKYTAAATVFQGKNQDLDWIEEEIRKREATPIEQPITAIYSRSDGVVGWGAAIDHYSKRVKHIEVNASHIGLGFNPTVWGHVLHALDTLETAQQAGCAA
ncbi:MAG: hypothetical protein AAAFM81_11225 [Pseudomonadota bacterium]